MISVSGVGQKGAEAYSLVPRPGAAGLSYLSLSTPPPSSKNSVGGEAAVVMGFSFSGSRQGGKSAHQSLP